MSKDELAVEKVGELLSMRSSYQLSEDCSQLDIIALRLEKGTSWTQLIQEFPHLKECELCREMAQEYQSLSDDLSLNLDTENSTAISSGATSEVVSLFGKNKWIKVAMAAAATVLVGISYFVWQGYKTVPPVESTLIPKGGTYDFQIAISRGQEKFPLTPDETVETGDMFGFFYTAPQNGYLAVFFVDGDGKISVLYPSNRKETAFIRSGTQIPLKDGALATSSIGCEWIVALFYNRPRDLQMLRNEIKSTMKTTHNCELHVAPQGTTSVKVQKVRGPKG